ncbi:MAG: SH3 domain-containing protein [Clostridiales bacterium]|nr:SH3 domain-containing protein [Clostridiales bacterium]
MNISVNLKKKAVMFLAAALTVFCVFSGLSVRAHAEEVGTSVGDSVNVRAEAVTGELVGSLDNGTQVVINDETEGSDGNTWYNITYVSGGTSITGYVRSDFIEKGVSSDDTADETADTDEMGEDTDTAGTDTQTYVPVTDNASYVVSSSIPEEIYPDGFSLTTVDYEGSQISALKADNSDVYLIYVESADDPTQGKLVVYDMNRSELIPFINFTTDDGFIVLLNIPSEELLRVSDRFVQTTYAFSSGTMDALQLGQTDDLASADVSILDYYYMYGVDQDGTYGWYVYDSQDGTIQRNTINMQYSNDGTVAETEDTDEDSAFSITDIPMIILIAAAVVLIILIIIIIVLAVRYHRLVELIDENEDEDEEDGNDKKNDEDDDISVTHIRTIRPRRGRKDEEDEIVVNEQRNEARPVKRTEPAPAPEPVSPTPVVQAPQSAAGPIPEEKPPLSVTAGEDTMDMYNSFSEALERMAAQESAAAASSDKPAGSIAEAVKQAGAATAPAAAAAKPASEAAPLPESGTPEVTVDFDDDDDLEFL